ncbi:sulfotransferase family 2 domain-containing protein [Nitratireductor sp. GCM10026969]|uniref:sulfotransferase family 2 domain-containing protein n=1 Tax=Nitratireductor sp. GCM10026969 TaxID=3252645 RepID=UPI003610A307
MIISYRHEFTFLHCPKTAGSAINMALAPHLGPLDIMLGSEGERVEVGIRPNLRARMDALRFRSPLSIFAAMGIGSEWPRRVLGLQAKSYASSFGPIVDHPHAEQVQAFDRKAWERHFKFTFVRNSYERMVSSYLFLTRASAETRDPFPTFVAKLIEGASPLRWRHFADSWPVYAIGDHIAVDFVGRYEALGADFKALCDRLDLPYRALSHINVAPRYDFREFYDASTRKLVHRLCEREIDSFGYRFEV